MNDKIDLSNINTQSEKDLGASYLYARKKAIGNAAKKQISNLFKITTQLEVFNQGAFPDYTDDDIVLWEEFKVDYYAKFNGVIRLPSEIEIQALDECRQAFLNLALQKVRSNNWTDSTISSGDNNLQPVVLGGGKMAYIMAENHFENTSACGEREYDYTEIKGVFNREPFLGNNLCSSLQDLSLLDGDLMDGHLTNIILGNF